MDPHFAPLALNAKMNDHQRWQGWRKKKGECFSLCLSYLSQTNTHAQIFCAIIIYAQRKKWPRASQVMPERKGPKVAAHSCKWAPLKHCQVLPASHWKQLHKAVQTMLRPGVRPGSNMTSEPGLAAPLAWRSVQWHCSHPLKLALTTMARRQDKGREGIWIGWLAG